MRTQRVPIVLLPTFLLVLPCYAQAPTTTTHDLTGFHLSVNVNLVVLEATVRDRKGHAVSDLREQDFEVYEDGVKQAIRLFRHEDIPVTVGLVVDHSGSMKSKMADVVAATGLFVRSSSPRDEMFVVNFNDAVRLGLPSGMKLTRNAGQMEQAIAGTPAAGMTKLYDAMSVSMTQLRAGKPEKKVLVVISDGGDNASSRTLAEVLKQLGASNVIVYTIGIFDEHDPDQNSAVLKRIADITGGEAFFPAKFGEVIEICERIGRDIRTQYTIGYAPAATPGRGGWRRIQLKAHDERGNRVLVRTRPGYASGEVR